MVHQHGARHVEHRQRLHRLKERKEDDAVEETVFVTMPNTFAATQNVVLVTMTGDPDTPKSAVGGAVQPSRTAVPPAVRTRDSSSDEQTAKATSTASARQSSRTAEVTSHASSHVSLQSTLKIDTASSPQATVSSIVGTVAAGVTSAAASASSSAEAAPSGMSGGAKAGLALGILVGVGALLGAILFLAHRKKRERAVAAQQAADNEKATSMRNMPPPPIAKEPTPSTSTQANAPRLSLRPVTQFDPAFPNRKSGANLLGAAAAGAGASAAAIGNRSPSPSSPSSPWERPRTSNASNPFSDPQAPSNSPPQDPFGNNAAIETPHASAPGTPLNFNSVFGNPAPAIAAAEKASAATPLPVPPTVNADNVPPSPAWTNDIPASPGPAPSGPLPIAAAAAAAAGGAPPGPNNVHRIQLDFKPSMADELELRAGQLVRMLHECDDGWALCVRLDRSQQGVVPRTCLSKHPVKPRQGPPRNGPQSSPRMQEPPRNGPNGPPTGHAGVPQPRPLSPANNGRSSPLPPANNGRSSPLPPVLSPARGRMSPAPRSVSPGPRQMPPPQGRARSSSNAPNVNQPRSMSPGPYGGGPQMAPPPQMGRPRSNSASQISRRGSPPGLSPMNPNAPVQVPVRKPIPGQAL
ncbi:hypothetical protein PMIN04_004409 [Paraphaeosphaeria minitans]